MSDAWWDNEYNKEYDLKKEILEYCKVNKLDVPIVMYDKYIRSWELEKVLNSIKVKKNETFKTCINASTQNESCDMHREM